MTGKIAIDFLKEITIETGGEFNEFEYQYFYNRYNVFVLIMPKGERIKSRTSIIVGV